MSVRVDKNRRPSLGVSGRTAVLTSLPKPVYSAAAKDLKDVLEQKIEELSRQLAEERQIARREKIQVTRLQREMARQKAERPGKAGKEGLSRDLERERMLRTDAEHRLLEMTKESDGCRSRLQSLQGEFKKMEEMVQNMVQYKSKIDQLKQEKASLSVTYENNLQKFGAHISGLERENMMLLNEVKKLELQMNNNTEGRDRSKLLLERLRMLEGENSSLVLENEQQRQQYEKCLDEIANQVVQALLAQKMLREECLKLQNRVHDLELQNRHLGVLFQQRMKLAVESAQQGNISMEQLSNNMFLEGSIESIQSMFSEQMSEHLAVLPGVTSPPPWLQGRLSLPGDRLSIVSVPGSVQSTPDLNECLDNENTEFSCHTRIETEFPATPSSPKMKHINVFEQKRETQRSSSVSSLSSRPSKLRTRSTSSLSKAKGLSIFRPQSMSPSPAEVSKDNGTAVSPGGSSRAKSHSDLNTVPSSGPSANQEVAKKTVSQSELTPGASLGHPANHIQPVPSVKSEESVSSVATDRSSQGQSSSRLPASRIPVQHVSPLHTKDSAPSRRKSDSSIKIGNQSLLTKPPTPASSTAASKSQQYSRSSSTGSVQTASGTSRLSAASKSGVATPAKTTTRTTQSKLKAPSVRTGPTKSVRTVPPGSPVPKHLSGIKTSVKDDNSRSKGGNSVTTARSAPSDQYGRGGNAGTVTVGSSAVGTATTSASVRNSPIHANSELRKESQTHYPRMGYTVTSQSGTKAGDKTSPVSASANRDFSLGALAQGRKGNNSVQSAKRDSPVQVVGEHVVQRGKGDNTNQGAKGYNSFQGNKGDNFIQGGFVEGPGALPLTKGQYFYDYSDEDSDINRPISKDFSAASTMSLDDLLDETLDNMETPLDSDFTTDTFFLFNPANVANTDNRSPVLTGEEKKESVDSNQSKETVSPLQGKPDIVQDTEKCEQRNGRQSLTVSKIPSSSAGGYRARRPKSLILSPKDKQILVCEYGTSSSSDSSSDEEWSYQYSYAKNIKQHELQAKMAKGVKTHAKKIVETQAITDIKKTVESEKNEKNEKSVKSLSQIPRPNVPKKPHKTPPPVARKPIRIKTSPTSPSDSHSVEERKSVEICVNTVVSSNTSVHVPSYYPAISDLDSIVSSGSKSEKQSKIPCFKNGQTGGGGKVKLEHTDCTYEIDTGKVERSSSKDDGYSTMSSDIQPEALEKYSDMSSGDRKGDVFDIDVVKEKASRVAKPSLDIGSDPDSALESSTHSNDIRNSNHSLSSQNSFSSEEKQSHHGSLGRVRAMKMMFEVDSSRQSPERESPTRCLLKSPPKSPLKTPPMSPPTPVKDAPVVDPVKLSGATGSRIPVPSSAMRMGKAVQGVSLKEETSVTVSEQSVYVKKEPWTDDMVDFRQKALQDFSDMSCLPEMEQMSFLREGSYDSSSASERGSDLTSLHISEDNILSDIPEEKDEYESSVEKQSESLSVTSLKVSTKFKFRLTVKRQWGSEEGLVRAVFDCDVEKQRLAHETADYEDMYGGCLNMDTPLERSASASDIYKKGDKQEIKLFPKLCRSRCPSLDELSIEDKVQDILKKQLIQQFAEAAKLEGHSDHENLISAAEMLAKKSHVIEEKPGRHSHEMDRKGNQESHSTNEPYTRPQGFSSTDFTTGTPSEGTFGMEEKLSRDDTAAGPVGEEHKKFNSQFYSLCDVGHVGSNPNISSSQGDEKKGPETTLPPHTCQDGDKDCRRCIEEDNAKDFDEISRQIESLSKTVNELHRSLTSLNSDNSDSGSESNEGDHSSFLTSAIGDKEIDGYQWVEDEFFLSPYGGETILGTSPFSTTDVSCDFLNEYMADGNQFEEQLCEGEAMHEDAVEHAMPNLQNLNRPTSDSKATKTNVMKPHESSILAGSIDKDGNFDSHEFISRRLKLEEERLQASQSTGDLDLDKLNVEVGSSPARPGSLLGQFQKDNQYRGTEKASDTAAALDPEKRLAMLDSMLGSNLGNSQESLDDNIGVDHVMCHRLLGKSRSEAVHSSPKTRPALDPSSKFFTRFGDLEKQAVAAFDFLNEMSTSASSCEQPQRMISGRDRRDFGFSGGSETRDTEEEVTERQWNASAQQRKVRRKLRPKTKKDQLKMSYANGVGRKLRDQSSTSPDSPNDASCDDVSFSDSCADSYSPSSPGFKDYENIVHQ